MCIACQQPHSRFAPEGDNYADHTLYPSQVPIEGPQSNLFKGWCFQRQLAARVLAEIMASASGFLPGWDTLKVISKMPPVSWHAGANAVTISST